MAQYLDWDGDGAPNNPAVFAALRADNMSMIMFETSDGGQLDKYLDSKVARRG